MTSPPTSLTAADLRFDAAINPYGCAPRVAQALAEAALARGYRHYGDPDAGALRAKLGRHLDVGPEHLVVYNGSGEALVWQALARLLLAGGTFVCPAPSYERFVDIGRRCARRVVEVPLEEPRWELPIGRFVDEARAAGAHLAMISNPNNPTGNLLLDADRLAALLHALPDTLVVVDEAYAEYPGVTFAPLVRRFANLAVLKTFSKAYGLAGLRVGYLVAHERVAAEARRLQIPWAVDTLALTAAEVALEEQEPLRRTIATIREDVRAMGEALRALPHLRPHPTDANFHLVDLVGRPFEELAPHLARRGMVVRRRADMPARVRITSMLPEANAALLAALAEARGAR